MLFTLGLQSLFLKQSKCTCMYPMPKELKCQCHEQTQLMLEALKIVAMSVIINTDIGYRQTGGMCTFRFHL